MVIVTNQIPAFEGYNKAYIPCEKFPLPWLIDLGRVDYDTIVTGDIIVTLTSARYWDHFEFQVDAISKLQWFSTDRWTGMQAW